MIKRKPATDLTPLLPALLDGILQFGADKTKGTYIESPVRT